MKKLKKNQMKNNWNNLNLETTILTLETRSSVSTLLTITNENGLQCDPIFFVLSTPYNRISIVPSTVTVRISPEILYY